METIKLLIVFGILGYVASGCGMEKDAGAKDAVQVNLPAGCSLNRVEDGNNVYRCPAACEITVDGQGHTVASTC